MPQTHIYHKHTYTTNTRLSQTHIYHKHTYHTQGLSQTHIYHKHTYHTQGNITIICIYMGSHLDDTIYMIQRKDF